MPAKKRAVKTKHEREAEKQAVKTLYCAGESLADAARAVGVTEESARQWAFKERWKDQVNRAQELVSKRKQSVTPLQNIVFDRALTGRETRNSHSRTALKVAQFMEEQPPEILFGAATNFKAHVDAAAKIAGDYEDSSANKFAVSLNLNQIVQSGGVKDVPPGDWEIVEE